MKLSSLVKEQQAILLKSNPLWPMMTSLHRCDVFGSTLNWIPDSPLNTPPIRKHPLSKSRYTAALSRYKPPMQSTFKQFATPHMKAVIAPTSHAKLRQLWIDRQLVYNSALALCYTATNVLLRSVRNGKRAHTEKQGK